MMENKIENKNVYLSSPKLLYHDPIFDRACKYIRSQNPHLFVEPSNMFATNAEWRDAFPGYLMGFDVCVIVAQEDYMVGRGVFLEWTYFRDAEKKVYYFSDNNKLAKLVPVKDIQVIDDDDWIEYAQVIL